MNIEELQHGKIYKHPHGHFNMVLVRVSEKIENGGFNNYYKWAEFKPVNLSKNMEFLKGETFTFSFYETEVNKFESPHKFN